MNSFGRIYGHFKRMDWILISVVVLLVVFGLLSIYSSSLGKGDFLNFKKQIIFLTLGFFLMIIFSFVDFRTFRNDPYLILILYFICQLLLLGLFFFAPQIRGVRSWYKFGILSFDPVELTKLALLILLAKYFSIRHVEAYQMRHIILSGLYLAVPAILIFLQPNLGSVLVLVLMWLSVLIISGIPLRQFFIICLVGIIIFTISWTFFFQDYQKDRFLSFFFPKLEPLGIGWSQLQSKIAIGSGGIFGKGLGQGSQTQSGFLPEPQTDFIFAAIAEEFGLIGAGAVLILFLFLFWRIMEVGFSARTNFVRIFAVGWAVILLVQLVINVGMNLGLLPIIGIPLPLVSYGGSGLIMAFIGFGILQNMKANL